MSKVGPFVVLDDGSLPVIDGRPVLVTADELAECCCDACAWFTLWYWDCATEGWLEVPPNEDDLGTGEISAWPVWAKTKSEILSYAGGDFINTPDPAPFNFSTEWFSYRYLIDRLWYLPLYTCEDPSAGPGVILMAWTNSAYMACATAEIDRPADPVAPTLALPEGLSDWLCDCTSIASPPDIPDEDKFCQRVDEYYWDCEEEIWVKEDGFLKIIALHPPGTIIQTSPGRRASFGSVQNCDQNTSQGPAPVDPPSTEELDEYCLAPSECPCPNGDPAEWPCGGMLETYVISQWEYRFPAGGGFLDEERRSRLKSAYAVSDRPGDRCGYSNVTDAPMEFSDDFGATWSDVTGYFLSIGLGSEGWRVSAQIPGPNFLDVHKSTGLSPIGFYSENVDYNGSSSSRNVTATVS